MKRVRKLAAEVTKPESKRNPAMLRLLQLEKDQAARMVESKDNDDLLDSSSSSEEDGEGRRRRGGARQSTGGGTSRRYGQKREKRFLDAFLLEESERKGETFISITAPKSRYPVPKLCRICLASAPYTCLGCGVRYCSIRCREIHKDTTCTQPLR